MYLEHIFKLSPIARVSTVDNLVDRNVNRSSTAVNHHVTTPWGVHVLSEHWNFGLVVLKLSRGLTTLPLLPDAAEGSSRTNSEQSDIESTPLLVAPSDGEANIDLGLSGTS